MLLPSKNQKESIDILNERLKDVATNKDAYKLNEHFVKHKSNKLLAKHIIYTNGKSQEMVADKIIQIAGL